MRPADPLDKLLALQHLGIKFGLDNIRVLCAALGHPEDRFASVIVGGTNGKGSVTAMVAHGLRAAGERTARYTSPHLVDLEERFVIDGHAVTRAHLRDAADRVLSTADALRESGVLAASPTFFEVTTAIAFVLFAEAEVRCAVVEVGLGGRFDATNVLSPIAAAITTVDFDHEQLLGSTVASIAFEKAGIIKAGIPVVVGERKADAVEVIRRTCDERGARFVDAWSGVVAEQLADGVRLQTPRGTYGPVVLALHGEHQIANAVVAVRVLEELRALPEHVAQGFSPAPSRISADAITAALRDVQWPGRLQWVELPRGRRLLLDAAHNPAGASALAAYLGRTMPARIPIVLAVMRDKDAAGIIATLAPHAASFILTRPGTERAADPAELARTVHAVAPEIAVATAAAPSDALEIAFRSGSTVCACGSIFLIGELLAALRPA